MIVFEKPSLRLGVKAKYGQGQSVLIDLFTEDHDTASVKNVIERDINDGKMNKMGVGSQWGTRAISSIDACFVLGRSIPYGTGLTLCETYNTDSLY